MVLSDGPVLIVTPHWIRDGGVSTHAIASATALAARGVDVHVLAARADPDEDVPGITVHTSPRLLSAGAPPAERVGAALEPAPSIVHLHQFEDPDCVALMRRLAPVAISVHGYSACTSGVHYFRPGHECSRAHGPGCVANLLARGCAHTRDPRPLPAAYRRTTRSVEALRAADLAISYTSVVDRHLAANGISRRRVIPLFSSLAARAGGGHETRRRVVFAGRVVAAKGVGVLIRAARDVDAEFVICGDGWQLDAMRRLARRIGVLDRVAFSGWLGEDELAQQLADASVVAMPSLWPEPFGLVGIEAFSAGRPVVASDTGGISDWLDHGVSGLLVAPGDTRALSRALEQLLADPERQLRMGAAGRESVRERYSLDAHVEALLDAYEATRGEWRARRGA